MMKTMKENMKNFLNTTVENKEENTMKKEVRAKNINDFLNTKTEEMTDGVYNVKLISFNIKEREDGRMALLMNFTVIGHDSTLFRYQMVDSFGKMIAKPVEEFLKHNGYELKEGTNSEILELMREVPVPIYYKRTDDAYEYTFSFNRRQVKTMTDNELFEYIEMLLEGKDFYVNDGLDHYI